MIFFFGISTSTTMISPTAKSKDLCAEFNSFYKCDHEYALFDIKYEL